MQNRNETALHTMFVLISTALVFWTARATIPFWIVLPAFGVTAAAPWLRHRRLTWESIAAVAIICVAATHRQRLAMAYAAQYRQFFFLLAPMLFYAGVVVTAGKRPGKSIYLGNVIWLALLVTLDVEGAAVSLCILSILILLALLLTGTDQDRHRFLPRLIPVAILVITATLLASILPVEIGPFSASTAQGLQEYLFGRATTYDWRAGRYSTDWWKPWPAAATNRIGSWLMRMAATEELRALAVPVGLSTLAVALSWIFLGAILQQGPGRAARRLAPSLSLLGITAILYSALVSMHSKQLNTLMFGASSPWMVDGEQFLPRTWQMFLTLRSGVTFAATPVILGLRAAVRAVAVLIGAQSISTCIRQAIVTQWDKLEGIGRRRDRIVIERTIKRIRNLEDDELLRDPRGSVIAMFYMAVNALYPLDLAMVRGETPTELTARVTRWYPDMACQIEILGKLFYEARYSTTDVTAEQVGKAKAAYQRLLEQLKTEAQHPRIRGEDT